jgi:uncharacterized protein
MASGAIRHLVLQPTPFCNLDCRYCYLPNRAVRGRMNLDLVERIVTTLFENGACARKPAVVWHAGEPLVLPPGYYEDALRAYSTRATR